MNLRDKALMLCMAVVFTLLLIMAVAEPLCDTPTGCHWKSEPDAE